MCPGAYGLFMLIILKASYSPPDELHNRVIRFREKSLLLPLYQSYDIDINAS